MIFTEVPIFKNTILKLIALHQEGTHWDFKKEWYSNKADLLHDIICMSNNLSNQDGYIIVGVDEGNNYSINDVSSDVNRRKTQDLVNFLRDKKFAGGIRPTVYVESILVNQKNIDVIVVENNRNTPYYLTESYQGVFANNIYTRIMDTNTPKTASADIDVVEKLWKKRFGIDATTLERALLYLKHPSDWVESEDGKSFYKNAPEFTIEYVSAEDVRDGYEFYLFNQCDSRPHWYDIKIYYHQTLLHTLGGVALDGGRCFTSTPQWGGLSLSPKSSFWDVSYKYFIKGSIEYIVHEFYINDNRSDERIARERFLECVLVFESESEQKEFNNYVKINYSVYSSADYEHKIPYFPEIQGYNMDVLKKNYLDSQILQQMLLDFRERRIAELLASK